MLIGVWIITLIVKTSPIPLKEKLAHSMEKRRKKRKFKNVRLKIQLTREPGSLF